MTSNTITIEVDPETDRVFKDATDEERCKMELLLRLRLQDFIAQPHRSLEQIMDEIGEEARARGMTPKVLESLLHGE